MGEQKRSGSFSWHARKIEEILFSSKWIFTRKMNCIELCEPRKMMPTSSTNCVLFALKESIILKPKLLMVWAHRIDTWWKVCNNGDFRSLLKNGKNLPLAQAMMIHSSRKGNAMINFIVVTLTVFYGLNLFKDNSCFFSSWGPPWKDNNYKSLQPFLMRLKIYLLSSCSHEFPDNNWRIC